MADLTTTIPAADYGRANSNVSTEKFRITVPTMSALGNGITRAMLAGPMNAIGFVTRMCLVAHKAGAATCTVRACKLNSDSALDGTPASANVKMAAAADTLTSGLALGASKELSLYAPGTSGQTDYKTANGDWVNSNLWFDQNDRLGLEFITSGGAGASPEGTLIIEGYFCSGRVDSRVNA